MSKRNRNKVNKKRHVSAMAAATRTETQKSAGKAKRYDAGMIEDFLEQLMWELRIAHLEASSHPGTCHPELLDQQVAFVSKYGTYLLPANFVENDGVTPDELNRASANLSRRFRKRYADGIEHMEALQELFEAALLSTSRDDCQVQVHSASDLLAIEDEGDDEWADDEYGGDDEGGSWPDGDSCSR